MLFRNVLLKGPRHYQSFCTHHLTSGYLQSVQRLDLSSYSTHGSRLSERSAKAMVVSDQLAHLIKECKQLKELYVGEEMMHAFVSPQVIEAVFCHANRLSTLDFTGFCDQKFAKTLARLFDTSSGMVLSKQHLENISFYMCMALQSDKFFTPFFQRLQQSGNCIKKLDLAHTQITSTVFTYIDPTHLTHLSLQASLYIACCSPLIPFLQACKSLVHLNLNADYSGSRESRFCQSCLVTILRHLNASLVTLDIGGHYQLDDDVFQAVDYQLPSGLKYLSLAYCHQLTCTSLVKLMQSTPRLYYLNIACSPLLDALPRVLNRLGSTLEHLRVIEISPIILKRYPTTVGSEWTIATQGRRTYYGRYRDDPRFCYSKKVLMGQPLSAMNKYWCYSY
ncbi:hypothetical protein K501DRAFT_203012 [Backusella circina FSU 941]|nr:hypothetical protein K501DRAFT_203012 [Backusella circina FSU 941]